MDDGRSADSVEVAGLRAIDTRFTLGHDYNGLIFSQRINQLDRTLPAHSEGQDGVREQNSVAHRKHGQGPYIVYFPRLRKRVGKRKLAHWLSLSVTHSSLDDTFFEKGSIPGNGRGLLDSIGIFGGET
jgi:hypothetical protein